MTEPLLDTAAFALLTGLGLISGFVNAIAGGGGLLVLPVMLWLGLPPLYALGTGKLQAVCGTLFSSLNYLRHGLVDLRRLWPVMLSAAIGSALGTAVVLQLSNELLMYLLPVMLLALAGFVAWSPSMNDDFRPARLQPRTFAVLVGGAVGFYGGFFGPGLGAIVAVAFASLGGFSLRAATGNAKPVVLTTNLISVLIFLSGGWVMLWLALAMALAQIVGAYLGSNLVVRRGAAVVRPMLLLVTLALALKLLLEQFQA